METSDDPLIDVELRGEHKINYKDSLFKNTLYETYLIVRIGDEYLYVSPFSYTKNGTEFYRLQIIQRQLANTKLENVISKRDIVVYLIAEGSSKDKGFKTSSIYIGDGSHGGFLSYDPYYGLIIKANRIEMVSGGTIGGDMVKNKDFNDFKTQIESRFTQIKNEINLQISQIDTSNLVKKNEVVAQINLSNEGVRIAGRKLQIDSQTVFNSDTEFNGKVTANRYIIVEGNGKRTIIGAGTIEYQEWSP